MRLVKTDVLSRLRGGNRRSLGRSGEIALKIANDPELLAQVFEGLLSVDPVLRMRAADAIEKATRKHPELLKPYKRRLLREIALIDQQEVRWHVAQILPRLQMTAKERQHAVSILLDYLEDKSSIVRTFAMQGLADFAMEDAQLRARVAPLIEFLTSKGTAAMRARGRKLLVQLKR
jgi:HEAT repeat protein